MGSVPVVLASTSPRRRELLSALGAQFEVIAPSVAELTEGDPAELVVENSLRKARAVATQRPDAVVIGADTDVVIDGEILGKPKNIAAARAVLTRLGGREHEVHGAVAVIAAGEERSAHELTRVRFRELEPGLLEAYLAANAWLGFAGGYAIQAAGSVLVDRVEGEVANVIGLPVRALIGLVPGLVSG